MRDIDKVDIMNDLVLLVGNFGFASGLAKSFSEELSDKFVDTGINLTLILNALSKFWFCK
jgi:hypothetical protein